MSRSLALPLVILVVLAAASCDLVDPMRPSIQPDSETFGNLVEVHPDPNEPGVWVATIRVGVPRALGRADDAEPTPQVADGLVALVRVTPDTVVIVDDRPTALEDIDPGTEVVAIPAPGTTTVYGDREIHQVADQFMDFASYARWRMPKLDLPGVVDAPVEDTAAINSSGVETAPIPLGDGTVLYFTARLRPSAVADAAWIGARREGLADPDEGSISFDRSFRTELGEDGWAAPEAVRFPETDGARHLKVTWVNDDETRCYVTSSAADLEPWVGISTRASKGEPWGEIVRMDATGDGDAFDAVAMSGAPETTLFASTRSGGGDIFLHEPGMEEAQRLQPEINSGGLEWAPRTGPAGELYLVRRDRQLRFRNGTLDEVRLPGPHRAILTEAMPTADGEWLFFASPKPRPVEFDFDILVAPLGADGALGEPIPVDDWRPR